MKEPEEEIGLARECYFLTRLDTRDFFYVLFAVDPQNFENPAALQLLPIVEKLACSSKEIQNKTHKRNEEHGHERIGRHEASLDLFDQTIGGTAMIWKTVDSHGSPWSP